MCFRSINKENIRRDGNKILIKDDVSEYNTNSGMEINNNQLHNINIETNK